MLDVGDVYFRLLYDVIKDKEYISLYKNKYMKRKRIIDVIQMIISISASILAVFTFVDNDRFIAYKFICVAVVIASQSFSIVTPKFSYDKLIAELDIAHTRLEDLYVDIGDTWTEWSEKLITQDEFIKHKKEYEKRELEIINKCGSPLDFPFDFDLSEQAKQITKRIVENRFGGTVE